MKPSLIGRKVQDECRVCGKIQTWTLESFKREEYGDGVFGCYIIRATKDNCLTDSVSSTIKDCEMGWSDLKLMPKTS